MKSSSTEIYDVKLYNVLVIVVCNENNKEQMNSMLKSRCGITILTIFAQIIIFEHVGALIFLANITEKID